MLFTASAKTSCFLRLSAIKLFPSVSYVVLRLFYLAPQAAQLDFSEYDLTKHSEKSIKRDCRWTLSLCAKLSMPLVLTVVRGCRDRDQS